VDAPLQGPTEDLAPGQGAACTDVAGCASCASCAGGAAGAGYTCYHGGRYGPVNTADGADGADGADVHRHAMLTDGVPVCVRICANWLAADAVGARCQRGPGARLFR
jgi:hypothetical protein